MPNNKTWILIADSSKARIFSMQKARLFTNGSDDSMQLVGQYLHDASRKKDQDLVSDRMGNYGSTQFVEPTDPKLHEAEKFAQELVKVLLQQHNEGQYRDLILVAPPAFMGLLNKHAQSHRIDKLITQTIEKDYTAQEGRDLIKTLTTHF